VKTDWHVVNEVTAAGILRQWFLMVYSLLVFH
ncbi:uncharacterized protein METZ01_LOCUS345498, partial [marine metagenome]